jgi:glycosyltransferase involved in cell wall biosynthesis
MTARASVVVPAHDEEATIAGTLDCLLGGLPHGALEVVVVCNGCSDRTAAVARTVTGIEVVEISEASKVAALRAGDVEASTYPRIYLDADVCLPGEAALALARVLDRPEPRVAGVRAELDLSASSRAVRRFYGFRQRLPVFQEGIICAGVYALNRAGRARFGDWPQILGDDQFVLRLFEPRERITLEQHRSRVTAPEDLGAVVRRGIRVRRGNAELTAGAAGRALAPPPSGVGRALRSCLLQPSAWPQAATWLAVSLWVRLLARVPVRSGDWAPSTARTTS